MPIRVSSANPLLDDFLAANVERSPTLREFGGDPDLRLSSLFEVRAPTITAVAASDIVDSAAPLGWWAFVLRDEDVLGIAELTFTDDAIVFGGINVGELARKVAAALVRAESIVGDREASAWILRIAPVFFTAVVLEVETSRIMIPSGERTLESESVESDLIELARRRIDAAAKLGSRPHVSDHSD